MSETIEINCRCGCNFKYNALEFKGKFTYDKRTGLLFIYCPVCLKQHIYDENLKQVIE